LRDETLEAFGLGYAPQSWEALTSYFTSKGIAPRELLEAGLVSERESGGVYDRFRHRVMFPIRDERGRMAGFGARILNPEDMPKFLNSPQTALFDKGRLLYGLDRARRAIRAADQAVIVEGYLDVIALHQAGYENAVSPMGTALTEHHLRLLKRFSQRIVLALDPDAAGDQATLRGLEVARQAMDREAELSFDARGLLAQEARLQADIRVTTLPPGMDPDEVVNRDAAEWQRLVAEARPVVIHVMETLATGKNLDDPKVKSEIAAQVLPLIADVPSPIERDTYRQRLARLLRVSEDSVFAATRSTRAGRSGSRARSPVSAPRQGEKRTAVAQPGLLTSSTYAVEAHALGVLMRRPDLLYRVNRALHEHGLSSLSADDFQHVDHQAIIRLLSQSVDQDNAEPLNYVLNGLSLPMMEIADSLLAHTERLDPSDERVLADVLRAILDLRQRAVRQSMEYLRFLMEDAQEQGDLKATQYRQTMVQHTLIMQRLNKAMGYYTSRVVRAS
jgi:DNA primase